LPLTLWRMDVLHNHAQKQCMAERPSSLRNLNIAQPYSSIFRINFPNVGILDRLNDQILIRLNFRMPAKDVINPDGLREINRHSILILGQEPRQP